MTILDDASPRRIRMRLKPLPMLIAGVLLLGAILATCLWVLPDQGLLDTSFAAPVGLIGLVALAAFAELAYVRVPHGDITEDLTFFEAVLVMAALALPPLVVIMLGANGRIEPAQIRTALRIIGPGRVLGLVTPRKNPGVSRVFHAAARRHSSRVAVLDWRASTARHPGWFAPDGNHMGPGGAQALARFLRRALRYAIPLDGRWERLPSAASGAFSSAG